jgi:two-component system, chemotaxis family, sensor kinase CheA
MTPDSLPEGIITRFRTLSLERISRVESVWQALVQGAEDEEAERGISRDLHTLKGDARIVGFEEVHVLAHKLEELLALAGQVNYRVSEDFDLVVTMATQFVGMLLRKRTGGASGIDLPGFIRQIDDVVRETQVLRRSKSTDPRLKSSKSSELTSDRISEPVRRRLAAAATNSFIEYLSARNPTSRARLRGIWQTLSEELARLQTTPLAPLLERHIAPTRQLAEELGKQIDLVLDVEDVRLESRVAEAIDVAVLHLVRNAIDHGIEAPEVRTAAGKPAQGMIRIRARERGGNAEISVSDDGAGICLQTVRAKAVERGLVAADRVLAEREVLDLLFHPGFSTRDDVSDVSGRGIGLDAVKSGLVKIGGSVRLTSERGVGTTVAVTASVPARQLRVFQFLAPGNAVSLAISARWTPSVEEKFAEEAIDPIAAIQLLGGSRQTLTGLAEPARDLVLRLRWGFLEIALKTSTEPHLVTAERMCPTPEDYPLEVIVIDGVEALLLRPEYVAGMIRRATNEA